MEVCHKKEVKGSRGVEHMALEGTVLWDGSAANTISYSSISGDVTACDLQYTR